MNLSDYLRRGTKKQVQIYQNILGWLDARCILTLTKLNGSGTITYILLLSTCFVFKHVLSIFSCSKLYMEAEIKDIKGKTKIKSLGLRVSWG